MKTCLRRNLDQTAKGLPHYNVWQEFKKKKKKGHSAWVRQGEEQEFRRKHSDTEEDLQSHSSGTLREHSKTITQTDSLWRQCWEFIFEHGH